ncbi:MAG TPA: hypothetical protein V6D10_01100 [Trichocoleus sp.]|jgi:hypothetical protein
MTEKTNKPTEATSVDAVAKADDDSPQTPDTASQLSDSLEETPVVRKRVVSEEMLASSDSDDDRSPGLVDRTGATSSEATDVPIVRKLVVSDPSSTSTDSDDNRSPELVERSAGEAPKLNEKTQSETEANELKHKEDT